MAEGVAILVKIGLKRDERGNTVHDFPDWNLLPLQAQRGERHEDHQLVKWLYDKKVSHDEEDAQSPRGTWLGLMVVTEVFANEAVAMWPTRVTILTEAQAQAFHDQRVTHRQPLELEDTERLTALKARRDLMVSLGRSTTAIDARIAKALDPDDDEPGVRKNPEKRWIDRKARLGFTIKP